MREKHIIDLHKGLTGLFILGLIAWYDSWQQTTALVYLAMHGSYGLLWVAKSYYFADKSWEKPCSAGWAICIWSGLSLYWIAPWLIVSGDTVAPAWLISLSVSVFAFGVFLHFTSDMQKHVLLEQRPGQLIQTGLWSRLRNPNYFGELLIYLSFAMLSLHWLPYTILALFVAFYWWPNMQRKDRSLSRYPGFAEYRARSWLFIPFIF